MQLKVSGKGNDSNNPNGISGDLLVLIEDLRMIFLHEMETSSL